MATKKTPAKKAPAAMKAAPAKRVPAKKAPAKKAAPKKAGRPSDYTPEIADRICNLIAESDISLRQICAMAGMPHRTTVLRWLADPKRAEFASKYARAREGQADAVFDGMADIEKKVLQRKLDPKAARVVLASQQWRADKLAPKKYGAKVTQEVTGPNGGPIQALLGQLGRSALPVVADQPR